MRGSPAAWSRAYAVQAKADLATRNALRGVAGLPTCQQLHFLQMACEKVSKAHRCRGGTDPREVQSSHAYAAKVIPLIAKQLFSRRPSPVDMSQAKAMEAIRRLSREVELLAPSVDDGGRRPENCEYPWEDAKGDLYIPAEHEFSELDRIDLHRAGLTFLKVLVTATEELASGSYTVA